MPIGTWPFAAQSSEGRRARYVLFVLLALAINGIDSAVTRSIADPRQRLIVAAAASFDVVVLVTAVYYWLLVRPRIRARWSVIPIALSGVLHATYFYPNAAAGRAVFAGLCEVSLIGLVAIRVRQGIRRGRTGESDGDPLDAIRAATASVLPGSVAAKLLATEFCVLYYALFSWRTKPHVPRGAKGFSLHKNSGQADLLFGLAFVAVLEAVPAHLLINRWSPAWAWVATGLSVYGAVWLIGMARSIELRPVLVAPDYVAVRYGLLFQLRIPRESLAGARRMAAGDAIPAVRVPRRCEPNVCIELRRPLVATTLFGRSRTDQIGLAADEPTAALEAMGELMSR
jgi:hypothetical protein